MQESAPSCMLQPDQLKLLHMDRPHNSRTRLRFCLCLWVRVWRKQSLWVSNKHFEFNVWWWSSGEEVIEGRSLANCMASWDAFMDMHLCPWWVACLRKQARERVTDGVIACCLLVLWLLVFLKWNVWLDAGLRESCCLGRRTLLEGSLKRP